MSRKYIKIPMDYEEVFWDLEPTDIKVLMQSIIRYHDPVDSPDRSDYDIQYIYDNAKKSLSIPFSFFKLIVMGSEIECHNLMEDFYTKNSSMPKQYSNKIRGAK